MVYFEIVKKYKNKPKTSSHSKGVGVEIKFHIVHGQKTMDFSKQVYMCSLPALSVQCGRVITDKDNTVASFVKHCNFPHYIFCFIFYLHLDFGIFLG